MLSKNPNFGQNSKVLPNIEIFYKSRKVDQGSRFLDEVFRSRKFGQKIDFCPK